MIRIYATRDRLKHAENMDSITVIGHGRLGPCAMVSAILESAFDALNGIAQAHPNDVMFVYSGVRPKQRKKKRCKTRR